MANDEAVTDETAAMAVFTAIRSGDVDSLRRLIDARPDLVRSQVNGRSALHVVADWPGYFPNGPEIVRVLTAAGADPNFRPPGTRRSTLIDWLRAQGAQSVETRG
jgi:hypothetical protein